MLRPSSAIFLLALGGTAWAAGCADDKKDQASKTDSEEVEHGLTKKEAEQPLVVVGDTTITVGEFADRLADQSPYLRARYNSPERRREFLDNMVRFELLAAEAKRRKLHELPEVERTTRQVMIQQMMKDLFEDRIKLSDISEEEVRQYYEAHEDEFHKPAQMRASHIQVSTRREAEKLLEELKASPEDNTLFRELAEEHNEDPETKKRGGDLGFFSRPEDSAADGEAGEDEGATEERARRVPEAVAEAAFEIDDLGDLYPEVVESEDGFHVVKLTGRRAALHRSFEEARRPIQNRLWREKRQEAVDEFVAKLRDDASIEENWEALGSLELDLPEGSSPTTDAPPSVTEPSGQPAPGVRGRRPPGKTPR
jgi:peptidyl-prolyl cis-trans isomerase C